MMLLGDPISSPSSSATDSVDNSFAKVQLLGLTSIYHLYTGRSDRVWECIGIAMRKAIVFGLFDERTKSWIGLDNVQREYRRRLAWYMLSLERCVTREGDHIALDLTLQPTDGRLSFASCRLHFTPAMST